MQDERFNHCIRRPTKGFVQSTHSRQQRKENDFDVFAPKLILRFNAFKH